MQHGKYRFIVGFLVAPLAIYAVFVIWPFVQSIYYSFTDWTGLSPDFKMVGFDNYAGCFKDDIFWKSLEHSLLFAAAAAAGDALPRRSSSPSCSMSAAGGGRGRSSRGVRGSGFYKIVYFFPQVLSIAIVALLFQFAYNPGQRRDQRRLTRSGSTACSRTGWAIRRLALWA